MATQYKTPGVYIQEPNSFPPSIVGVETAVPCFIAYTEKAVDADGREIHLLPRRIEALAEYEAMYGGNSGPRFRLADGPPAQGEVDWGPAPIGAPGTRLAETGGRFNVFDSLRLFYANGGGSCYIVSCGTYGGKSPPPILASDLKAGLDASNAIVGPTIIVIPDLVLIADPAPLAADMLRACQNAGDRMALLDIWGTDPALDWSGAVACFRKAVSAAPAESHKFGAAYFPPLQTSIVSPQEVGIHSFSADPVHLSALRQALLVSLAMVYPASDNMGSGGQPIADAVSRLGTLPLEDEVKTFQLLTASLPQFGQLLDMIAGARGILPPSGAMAGIWAQNDSRAGVWNAPANIGVVALIHPALPITDIQQQDLSLPVDGLAINAIRTFPGRGALVWGARTLDGNSNDWRYIQVRRTTIYIEQSVKQALETMVFKPNTAQTWVTVTATIESFLHGLWAAGGLMGAAPSEAYTVQCGLGSTMTSEDVLNGVMRVQIAVQMVHPAKFIVLTFKQQMSGGA